MFNDKYTKSHSSASNKDDETSDVRTENKQAAIYPHSEEKDESLFNLKKITFKRSVQRFMQTSNTSRTSRVDWDESEYDTFVKTVRRYGNDQTKLQEALHSKTKRHIKRFSKALCKQIDAISEHPESDLLEALLEASSDEDEGQTNVLKMESKRKKKERNKRKMVGVDLCAPYPVTSTFHVPKRPKKCLSPTVPIEKLEEQIKNQVRKEEEIDEQAKPNLFDFPPTISDTC